MTQVRVLVAEDNPKTSTALRLYLEQERFAVEVAESGPEALDAARSGRFDFLLLDVMLPGLDGWQVCERLRSEGRALPVLMLTARTTEEDLLRGLGVGADDYVTKPFSPREVVARVKAVLRRGQPGTLGERRWGRLAVHLERQEVRVDGALVPLTAREFHLLRVLMSAPGRVFSREELISRAFGEDSEALDRTVDAHIKNLRRKLEVEAAHPTLILTAVGLGYRFGGGSHG
ncbi:response regulator transcription factor [Myxococcus landrumensis]|uniref:Response regulator transcription factor n=1 Tax=Myxococcus landrumensis TaxID=2813577 RepID=A0ABX7N300_9BACT|nr:response regulator transcription factor [Myxococcus landrumus]QSQ13077.1 response regulator transcription factor [Myxococcus landrumus]